MLGDYQLFVNYSCINKYLLSHRVCSEHCSKCWGHRSEPGPCVLLRTIRDTRTPLPPDAFFFFGKTQDTISGLNELTYHMRNWLTLRKQLSTKAQDGSHMCNSTSVFYFHQISPHSKCQNHFPPPCSSPKTTHSAPAVLPGFRSDTNSLVI